MIIFLVLIDDNSIVTNDSAYYYDDHRHVPWLCNGMRDYPDNIVPWIKSILFA